MAENMSPVKIMEEGQNLWNLDRQPVGCSNCQRSFLVNDSQINTLCPFCCKGRIEPQPLRLRPTEPERLLPFKVKKSNLRRIYDEFISGVWFRSPDCTSETLLERTKAVFWPLWMVDSDVEGRWQMEAGFDYQVESSKEYYQDGQWRSRSIIENRINWEPRIGEMETHVDNVIVQALEEHQNRQEMTGGYNLKDAKDFHPDMLNSALIEAPDLPPKNAWVHAKPKINQRLSEVCTKAANAQHVRNFAIKADYQNLNWTQFLLPMYLTNYKDDDGEPQVLVINGQTGIINGPRLSSQKRGWKIAAIVGGIAGLMLLLALVGFLLTAVFPPAAILATILAILGFGAGLGALFPAIWPAQWNRKHQTPKITERK